MQTHTPKHFVIQLGSLAALYVSITALLIIIFNVINLTFPDAVEGSYASESAREAIRMSIAIVIVFFPTYLALTRITNQARRKETDGEYTSIARWLIYLSLLVAGGVLLGDLVTLLNYFLNGEITTRFLLKVAALFLVVGAAFWYYLLDIRGYITKHVQSALYFAVGVSGVVLVTLVAGFMNIETPAEVRDIRIDEQQVMDLQDIQFRIEEYYRNEGELPQSLADVFPVGSVYQPPSDLPAYELIVTSADTYELCATFLLTSAADTQNTIRAPFREQNYNWEHEAGEWCFQRTIPSDKLQQG